MKITKEEVEKVAHLARLHLSAEELETMTTQLDTILSYVAKLDELDTTGVQAMTHAFSESNAFREDKVTDSLAREDALANGPCQNGEAFVVPRVI
ncbi:MAG: Asp-tRNA(Asn)/Glu-tRNA(Gln) amidotransferase subunit GatC [Proteobacteria bacterium]|jgi:aspartyl-tRNA(Asn)/glutamyl-tRNA(Gln) amidotransferase subunit C|nr:Asp-tRNA(Asn)/Glu-tRNA(Gln) amidotransferase subunit GatC [Desulfocapsa sp.]MBU3944656.1 Asp-tRNA(Asn)/Glu-tRNA(Gln) amidotransferase subunit GatC [Pseudomonadota bacterium]MCG2743256.1 Asp-tRNA(Asn)/Glu-tRNA(Gln) amidotransferase subunit GatC [Desulfobacteraceae bacterium]MDO8948417.1 Asp-tRNA(Asn)/Glu-tRNA(Gln) amidotransferase subunit GatC [Desulfocapsaceae bacterium]MBU4030303.1 Asp-tRNA(Asn)/Glu-tRNA(Gln) amidotransferase subunit GatC [Pseudomonadota bacterium]